MYTKLFLRHPVQYILTRAARMGKNMVAVAVLLVNSVKKQISVVMIMFMKNGEMCENISNCSPNQWDKPDACIWNEWIKRVHMNSPFHPQICGCEAGYNVAATCTSTWLSTPQSKNTVCAFQIPCKTTFFYLGWLVKNLHMITALQ